MSEVLRIAFVGEGPTDAIVVEAAIVAILGPRAFVLTQLQPEHSVAFATSETGTGWGGVYRWCRQVVARAPGLFRDDLLFASYNVLVVHLDADVSQGKYENAGIDDQPADDLPCAAPCPPASDSTNPLRAVLLHWMNENSIPPKTVFCTPSRNTEAWVLAALYTDDPVVTGGNLECHPTPRIILQAKPANDRVVKAGRPVVRKYRARAKEITEVWPTVRERCTEADRFSNDLAGSLY